MSTPPKPISSNLKFFLGIFIMFCGWVICFDIFMLVIGIPFFLIGMLLVFFSKKSILTKCITVAIPIIAWFICFQLILNAINAPTAVTFLIPENYVGEFRVVEGEKDGAAPKVENGRLIFTVPSDGIAIVKSHLNIRQNSNDIEFYFMDANNQRVPLGSMTSIKDSHAKFPAVLFDGMMSPPTPAGQSSDVPSKLDYVYDRFVIYSSSKEVGKPISNSVSSVEKNLVSQMKFDSITDAKVKLERGIK